MSVVVKKFDMRNEHGVKIGYIEKKGDTTPSSILISGRLFLKVDYSTNSYDGTYQEAKSGTAPDRDCYRDKTGNIMHYPNE